MSQRDTGLRRFLRRPGGYQGFQDLLGAQRFQLKVSTGRLSHEAIMETIGLYGTEVVPLVKDMLSGS